ncbi:FHA domain-containing protein [Cellulomonas sp. zg-ZUI222]|uniref:FHA domain-containing protein n=1 Tax=Cellulomonas wangleii TaxID=2816956 RepID=A0ABX8D1A2_9CELL|nr:MULTISPECIES: FHA domain-containing protein [Cellulomonas]MBO0900315.1 FHA domain-containing protein [Cellulomonas sp. zg-ZUI22]MBO0920771.1 FHA domain-containing protein [Cellulomonas wangleii]MBO0926634.1 FHA domain-containing protein [Cellulomonas wangleii]QVI60811.1 FHA domain-containing protein [Cellulomonas wangleii]
MSDDRRAPGGGLPAYRGDGPDTTVSFGSLDPADTEAPPVGLTSDEAAAVQALPPTSALLLMQRGPSAGARFLLDAERTTAGRSTSADIFLDDVTVSRKHAEFVRDGNQFVVRDIGSLNGTYVNRERIDAAVLRPGDEVQIGKYRMTFHPSPHRDAS